LGVAGCWQKAFVSPPATSNQQPPSVVSICAPSVAKESSRIKTTV
jgi:hypothetical protein